MTNETQYDTRVLRSIFIAVYRLMAKAEGRASWWSRLRVTVKYAHSDARCFGWAYLHGGPMRVMVGRPGQRVKSYLVGAPDRITGPYPTAAYADTVAHELMHSWGYRHRQFKDGAWALNPSWNALLARFPATLPMKAVKPRPTVDLRQVRYQRVLNAEARWLSKLKRAQTMVRKYRDKRRGYERRMQLAAKSS